MEWADWQPFDAQIRAEFGYPLADDRAAALELKALLPPGAARWREVGALLRNRRNLVVAGCGPGLAQAPASLFVGKMTVACDGAAERLRELGVVPAVVVTDLDGQAEALRWAAASGALMVVHAHGDNRAALRDLVPGLGPLVFGTHQVQPEAALEPLRNMGGFTDGDRAVLLCEALGGLHALLVGFEFDAPPSAYSHAWNAKTKPAKLQWAKRIVADCHARGKLGLQTWMP